MPTGREICEKQLYKVIDDLERIQVNEEEIEGFLPDIFRRLDWMDKNDIIKRIVTREFGRFVRYYQDAPELEEVTRKESDDAGRKKKERHKAQKGYTRFFINIGKKDHVQPVHIIEMLNRNVPGRVDVGRIDLMQSFSFFECPSEFAEEIVTGMNGINYKGRQIHVEIAEQRDENPDAGGYNERRKSYDGERKSSGRKTVRGVRRAEKPEPTEKKSRDSKSETRRHAPQRAPKINVAQDDDFWNGFDDGDWRQFFRNDEKESYRGKSRNAASKKTSSKAAPVKKKSRRK